MAAFQSSPSSAAPPGAGEALLRVEGIAVHYPRMALPALADVGLTAADGEFVSLLGPSGCGKTTLLRVIGGLLQATAGSVTLDGGPSMLPTPEKAFVFQHFNLFPWRTALGNVAYTLEIQRVAKAERLARAREALELVGLREFEASYPSELSGGMQQRVGIARALTLHPRLLLMDEPFGAVDALTRERLQTEMSRICSEQALTTLLVTHSIDEAILLSDRILVMASGPGRIIAEVEVPFERPRDLRKVRLAPAFAEVRNRLGRLLGLDDGDE